MKVNKLAIILITFFFGGLGIHKFMEGKPFKGILYGLFCWTFIPSVIAFFELFGYSRQQTDENGNITI